MIGIVTENAERRGTQHEMRSVNDRQSNPSRSEDAPKLAMREERDLSVQLSKMGYEPVGAVGNLSGSFTPGTTVAEDIPVRSALANVRRARAFVITIVPFGEVWLDFHILTQSNQSTSPLCPTTRATERIGESGTTQSPSKLSRFLFAMFGQRNVCATGMLVG
jgi:hypothetical protein